MKDQNTFSKVMNLKILITFPLHNVWILLGQEILFQSLLGLKVSATFKIAIFPYLRFQRFQIDMLENFLLKKNQKKISFLSKDIGGKRFFLVNYLN